MNVREFRAKISELTQEPIEVVRYSETVGFWVPIAMTTEPKKRTSTKWSTVKASKGVPRVASKGDLSEKDIEEWLTKLKKFNDEMKKMTVK